MKRLIAILALAAVPLLAACNPTPTPGVPTPTTGWDGQPWTNTHPEPCRKYEPITTGWIKAHPNNPCAKAAKAGR